MAYFIKFEDLNYFYEDLDYLKWNYCNIWEYLTYEELLNLSPTLKNMDEKYGSNEVKKLLNEKRG